MTKVPLVLDLRTNEPIFNEDENKCRCGRSNDELHICPGAADLYGDYETLCNCCEYCEYNCAMDI